MKNPTRTGRFATVATAALLLLATVAVPAFAASTAISGGRVSATASWDGGVRTSGTVTDTSGDGACVHADVKVALKNVNDYTWREARACGAGVSRSWNTKHVGPILSAFPRSSVQGIYVRVCRERAYLADACGAWTYIGR